MSEVSKILKAIQDGEQITTEQMFPLVYDELRNLAARNLRHEKPGQTLQTTALVHEAYLRLVDGNRTISWNSRGHFFAAAAEAMRRILIEAARRRSTQKRGRGQLQLSLNDVEDPEVPVSMPIEELMALDEALGRLESFSPHHAKLVKLRYFAGLTLDDAANSLGVSVATVKRQWLYARAWLFGQLDSEPSVSETPREP